MFIEDEFDNLHFSFSKDLYHDFNAETDLSITSFVELCISKQSVKIVRAFHKMILGLKSRPESLEQRSVVPDRNFVVLCFHAVDESLNRVSIIVKDEAESIILCLCCFSSDFKEDLHSRVDFVTDQVRECLHSKLQRSLTSDKDPSLDSSQLLTSNECSHSSTARESNTAEYSLIEHLDVLDVFETRAWDTVCRSSRLSNDEVAVFEIATESL
jgi:hypothetical protein